MDYNVMDELTILLLVLVLILQGVYLSSYALKNRRTEVVVPIFLVMLTVFGTSLPPAVYALFTGEYTSFLFGYSLKHWRLGYVIEIIFFTFFILGLLFSQKHYPKLLRDTEWSLRSIVVPWWLLLLLFMVFTSMSVLLSGEWSNWGYEDTAVLYVNTELSDSAVTVGGIQRLIDIAITTPLVFVLILAKEKPKGAIPTLVSIILFLLFLLPTVLGDLTFGARGKMVALVLMAAIVWASNKQWRRGLWITATAFAFVVVASSGIRTFRSTAYLDSGLSNLDRAKLMWHTITDSLGTDDSDRFISSTLGRLDMVQNAGILAHVTELSNNFALYRPYIGSLLALLPRYFWYDKPVPLSKNDSVLGTPYYLVGALRGTPWSNAGVSASGIAFWQFWWPGVIIAGFLNALLLFWLSRAFLNGGLVGLFLYISLARQFNFLMVVGLDLWILVIVKTVLPLYCCVFLLNWLFKQNIARKAPTTLIEQYT